MLNQKPRSQKQQELTQINNMEMFMTVKLEDRPIETLRQEVIDQLIYNYSHGVISNDAFERRLDKAMASQQHQELADLVSDLQLQTDSQFAQQKEQKLRPRYSGTANEESDNIVTIFASASRSGIWQVPKVINVINVFGSAKIDFTDAVFSTQTITLNVKCIFGSDKIYVPENINVVTKTFSIFGSTENKAPSIADRQAPTIILEGFVLFGDVQISIKRTIKEKFVTFANELKTLFNSQSMR